MVTFIHNTKIFACPLHIVLRRVTASMGQKLRKFCIICTSLFEFHTFYKFELTYAFEFIIDCSSSQWGFKNNEEQSAVKTQLFHEKSFLLVNIFYQQNFFRISSKIS